MGACEHPTAGHSVDIQHFRVKRFNQRLDFCIVQLPNIELPAIRSSGPSEENIRRRLHQTLSHNDALPVMFIRALPSIGFEDRVHRFFELEKQWIVSLRHHQGNPASPANAANADHFNSRIRQLIPIEQDAMVVRQRVLVDVHELLKCCLTVGVVDCFWVKDKRRLVLDPDLPANGPGELGKIQFGATAGRSFLDPFSDACRKALGRDSIKSAALVFAYQTPSGSNLENSRMCSRYLRALLTAQSRAWLSDRPFARPASTTDATSRLTSHSQGAREVVDIEDDVAFRCRESTEIHEMAVTARLHIQPSNRQPCQVGRHDSGSPTIKGKRRLQHPAISNRNEPFQSAGVRFLQNVDRIWSPIHVFPLALLLSWDLLAQEPSSRFPFVR